MDLTTAMADNITAAMVGPAVEETPAWVPIFENVITSVCVLGIVVNLVTLVTLIKNGDCFSEIIGWLFKYQSILDTIVCLFYTLTFDVPGFWRTGNYVFDAIVCHLWHGQYIFWSSMLISIWNLVALAIERYICVCHPMKYMSFSKNKLYRLVLCCLLVGLIGPSGSCVQVRMRDGICYNEFLVDGPEFASFMAFFAISTYFSFYAIPGLLMVLLYGLVIRAFRRRAQQNLGASGTAAVVDKASAELTKTAVVVTLIFLLCYTFENHYYLLAYLGYATYSVNSPYQKISAFLALVNSVANPFVYATLMPAYRRSLMKTLKLD